MRYWLGVAVESIILWGGVVFILDGIVLPGLVLLGVAALLPHKKNAS